MIEHIEQGTLPAHVKACIALTSWKKRINTVGLTIYNLFTMCGPEFHIVLTLAEEEFPKKEQELPKDLVLMNRVGMFEILWVKKNYKALKKVLFTMAKYPQVPIISADDDCLYTCNYANELYNCYLLHNDKPITYNKIQNNPYITQGPCTLYPPIIALFFKQYILPTLDTFATKITADDSVFEIIFKNLHMQLYSCHSHGKLPLKFHTTFGALNPEQYDNPNYEEYLLDG